MRVLSKNIKCVSISALSLVVSGCNIHPLPVQVSLGKKIDTFKIVKNIRCEAKFQVIKSINELLQTSPSPIVKEFDAKDVVHKEVLDKISEEHKKFTKKKVDKKKFRGKELYKKLREKDVYAKGAWQSYTDIAKTIQNFSASAISYSFRFQINVSNDATGGAAFRLPFTNGSANFSGGAGLSAIRDGVRTFTMVENFVDLEKLRCGEGDSGYFLPDGEEYTPLKQNYVYPLTGSVNMSEIMESFLRLGGLGGGTGDFTDTITFTTNKEGNLGANVTVNPGPLRTTRLASANLGVSASRNDLHRVVITLAFPKPAAFKTALQEEESKKPVKALGARKGLEGLRRSARLEAAVAQCIQRAEAREDRFNTLRNVPPELYCFEFAQNLLNLPPPRSGD